MYVGECMSVLCVWWKRLIDPSTYLPTSVNDDDDDNDGDDPWIVAELVIAIDVVGAAASGAIAISPSATSIFTPSVSLFVS